MASDVLGKTVRISDRRGDPNGAKLEVWTRKRHKYLVLTADPTETKIPKSTISYINEEKISASLSDDEVIASYLDRQKQGGNVYQILQDPWQEEYKDRLYGLSPYYLNDGSSLYIKWTQGTSVKTSNKDDADSFVDKRVELIPPESAKLGKYYILDKSSRFGYSTDVKFDWQVFSGIMKDSDILSNTLNTIKFQIQQKNGTQVKDNKLEVCEPSSQSCSLIPFVDFLATSQPILTPTTSSTQSTADGTQSNANQKPITLQGIEDGFTIKALTSFNIKGIIGEPTEETLAVNGADLDELDEEYTESAIHTDEEQIKLDLIVFINQGDSEGTEEVSAGGGGGTETTSTGSGINTNGSNAGGSGIRRFQQQLTVRGRTIKNGEIPDDLLAKVDFGPWKLEKNAAKKFSALNTAYKKEFGSNFTISGPYRPFNVSNDIFDWDYFDKTGKGRKKGTNGGVAAAKPGTSKHGWGQAMDIGGFGNGPGNKFFDWMEKNAKNYGWINPAWAKRPGAGYEPWHWEYIGDDLFAP